LAAEWAAFHHDLVIVRRIIRTANKAPQAIILIADMIYAISIVNGGAWNTPWFRLMTGKIAATGQYL
jgi:hypothetical protein